MNDSEEPKPRRTYRKPELTQVELRPDEAVLGSCKVSTSGGPATAGCGATGVRCITIGS